MQMLLTSQQGRVCRKSHWSLRGGESFKSELCLLSPETVWSHCSNSCWKCSAFSTFFALCVNPDLSSTKGTTTSCITIISLGMYLFSVSPSYLHFLTCVNCCHLCLGKRKMFHQWQMFLEARVIPSNNEHNHSYKTLPAAHLQDTPFN